MESTKGYRLYDEIYNLPSALISYRDVRQQLAEVKKNFTANLKQLFDGPLRNPYDFKNAIQQHRKRSLSLCGFLNMANEVAADVGEDALSIISTTMEEYGYSPDIIHAVDRSSLEIEWLRIVAMMTVYEECCQKVQQRRIEKAEEAGFKKDQAAGRSNEVRGFWGRVLVASIL